MKIGLEFEGIIIDYKTGQFQRWSKLPEETRNKIKRLIYVRREQEEPVDRYDCLAEVRTIPLLNPSPEQLIEALFTQIELANRAFSANGLSICWDERNIPEEFHNAIQYDIEHPARGYKEKKETKIITNQGIEFYNSVGNRYRGGGLHINVSPIPEMFSSAFVLGLHNLFRFTRTIYKFQSHYRTNILYRTRFDPKDEKYLEPIVEYMSLGLKIPTIIGWKEDLKRVSEATWFKHAKCYEYIGWAWNLIDYVNDFFKVMKI